MYEKNTTTVFLVLQSRCHVHDALLRFFKHLRSNRFVNKNEYVKLSLFFYEI